MGLYKTRRPARRPQPSRVDWRSFALGALCAALPLLLVSPAEAFDVKHIGNVGKQITASIKSLAGIKKSLDSDVRNLTENANALISHKDKLLDIKEQLFEIADQTRQQIHAIQAAVSVIEGHLERTQADIETAAQHVQEIDEVALDLQEIR